jgi:hypothetical protein
MTDRNSYKKWTSEDDELLRNLVLANVSPFDIAAQLGRSVSTSTGSLSWNDVPTVWD